MAALVVVCFAQVVLVAQCPFAASLLPTLLLLANIAHHIQSPPISVGERAADWARRRVVFVWSIATLTFVGMFECA